MVARRLGFKFVDTDDEIAQRLQMPVSEIFSRLGEARFREIEKQVIAEVASCNRQVIATGGGVPLDKTNVEHLRRNGLMVCLTASAEVIYRRTLRSDTRPLLRAQDRFERVRELLEARQFYYSLADHSVDTSSRPASAVAREIVELYQSDGSITN